MTAGARRATFVATLLVLVALGGALRLHRWRDAPPGPWIDEALALRAARVATATGAPLLGTSPLQPPDAGFVNFWIANSALRVVSAIDRAAGGGMASVRAISIAPALALLLAAVALAAEAANGRAVPLLTACALLSTSTWLLTTGRWGWLAVGTSVFVVLAAYAALRAARLASFPWAGAAGVLLGTSAWGYPAAWALVPLPAGVLAAAILRRRAARRGGLSVGIAAAGFAGWSLVVAPLALHYASHPERALARTRELSASRDEAGETLAALGRNVAAYARLFTFGGDPNERHGDPARPAVPLAVTGLALFAAAEAFRRPGPARLLAAVAAVLSLASLLAVEENANAFRTSLVAPFLLVLASLGAERLVEALGPARRRLATGGLALVIVSAAISDASGFLRWLSSPRLDGAFGGPERALADAVSTELRRGRPADVLLAPGASRNAFVVDALLQSPSAATPAVRQVPGLEALRYLPSRDLLFAGAATEVEARAPLALGAMRVASGGALPGFPGWTLWRLPAGRARLSARAFLDRFPMIPAPGEGSLLVPEEGLYTFASRGGLDVRLDGGVVFDASRPAGSLTARLGAGRHALVARPVAPGVSLRVTGPDGFVLPAL